ncbi:MAG: PTS system mannose/fructose/sorbose family transporter subunit IID [Anaerolineae bacterium]
MPPPHSRPLARRDIFRSWIRWLFFSHANYNWERLQGTGFAHAMAPIIEVLYQDKNEIRSALRRHLAFFNTEPDLGGAIHGIVIAMEEQRAGGADVSDDAIANLKNGLMGPLSALGDTLKQGLWISIWLAFGIQLAAEGNLLGPILFFAAVAAFSWGLGWAIYYQGYRQGRAFVSEWIRGGAMDRIQTAAAVVGAGVLGGLAAQFVNISTPLAITAGEQTVRIQEDVLDVFLPSLLPLALVLVLLWLLRRRVGALSIMAGIFAVTLVLNLIGWFTGIAIL